MGNLHIIGTLTQIDKIPYIVIMSKASIKFHSVMNLCSNAWIQTNRRPELKRRRTLPNPNISKHKIIKKYKEPERSYSLSVLLSLWHFPYNIIRQLLQEIILHTTKPIFRGLLSKIHNTSLLTQPSATVWHLTASRIPTHYNGHYSFPDFSWRFNLLND